MAGLTTGIILRTSQVVKGQHGEDHPKKIIVKLDLMRKDKRKPPFLEIDVVFIEINLCVLSCVWLFLLFASLSVKFVETEFFTQKGKHDSKKLIKKGEQITGKLSTFVNRGKSPLSG